MPIVVLGMNHRTSQVGLRERYAFEESHIPDALAALRQSGMVEEAVILSTCNRVELYGFSAATAAEALAELRRFVIQAKRVEGLDDDPFYSLSEPLSVEHLFKVASGLDSMVLGETEILGQLKKAYDLALRHRHTGGRLNKAFQKAFNVAKYIRTETQIQRGTVSVGSVAVDLAEKIFDSLSDRTVMVIGAGDTSEKTARALLSRGAKSVLVSNRSFERAAVLAAELGGRAIHFDAWSDEFAAVDIIISSTSAPHYVIDPTRIEPLMKSRQGRSLLLIDIAVPRDIDPSVSRFEGVYLYNIDDLQLIAEDSQRHRREEVSRCEEIIRHRARELIGARVFAKADQDFVAQEFRLGTGCSSKQSLINGKGFPQDE